MGTSRRPLIAAVGLDFEAAAANGAGIEVVSGLNRQRYLRKLHEVARTGVQGIISFGVAGGLSPELNAGDVVVASAVVTARRTFRPGNLWLEALLAALPHAYHRPVFGARMPLFTVSAKKALWDSTGCATVDMESRDAAEVAAHYGLPFAVLRVVLDPARRAIPLAALAGADSEGKTGAKAVVKSLLRRPGDLPALVQIAIDAQKANSSLHHSRKALGPLFAFREQDERSQGEELRRHVSAG
jgi:hopanoid-associated phosphorylase